MEVMITLGNVKLKFRISFIASIYTINVIMHHGKQVGGTMMTRQTNTCKLMGDQFVETGQWTIKIKFIGKL